MSIATDRDLLILEPNLFRDVSFAAQYLLHDTNGIISGTSLGSSSADFNNIGLSAGYVILANEIPLEIISVLTANSVEVSRLRVDRAGPLLTPESGSSLALQIMTFMHQIGWVHAHLFKAHIRAGDVFTELVDDGKSILNIEDIIRTESLGALAMIFSGASSLIGDDGVLWNKAQMYRERFQAARSRLQIAIDDNGDGIINSSKRFDILNLGRG